MADMISGLPDGILCHILSFVPTSNSVTTCVLSKRWKHLWRFVPALNFSDYNPEHDVNDDDYEGFIDFIDRENYDDDVESATDRPGVFVYSALLLRDNTQPIQKFSLMRKGLFRYYNLKLWLTFVLQRGVECLQLRWTDDYFRRDFPLRVLRCQTLVDLNLHGFRIERFSSLSLPSLKTLRLKDITISIPDLLVLLAGCPILEDLRGSELACWDDDSVAQDFSVRLAKLTRADIGFHEDCDYSFNFPLQVLSNVEFLRIEISKVFHDNCGIPNFHKLTHLELIFLHYDGDLLMEVLKNCPKLQVLHLSESETDPELDCCGDNAQEYWVESKSVPECLLLHLRTCSFERFKGLQLELQLARYILKNAEVLRSMKICCKGEKKMIKKNLASYPRSSAICKLLFP